ncbi:MAG: GNAT family N-acetyltransferase [Candidatus Bathyarchaeota archaeon]|nr:GNAT family N-acetyltransferase [Candidatus Bathyarchaeota archaeon]MDH5732376.1 GNAT family N-acetyltransferase [Candidatus Bathyarchaeota archaeon]
MSMQIVDADGKDVESLIEIYSSPRLYHNREEASWFVQSFFDYHHVKVVKHEEKVIGAVFWNVVEEKHHGLTEIADFWIDENFRRKGLGERLLRAVIEDMKRFFAKDNYTVRKVLLTTGEDNEPAKKLYEKVGFQMSAVLKDLFAKGENELVYILTLNS